ncbi:ABC transporter permease [Prolixibacter sp. NT017]|nr:ABC transporter permease [Prolixibacter sp. NT017]GET27147.1 ABC transporter permease [Prolixibacter sp. NT017]
MIFKGLKIALKSLLKQKLTTLLNILGLTLAFFGFLLIMIYLQHELSYDKFNKNYDRLYLLTAKMDQGKPQATLPALLKKEIGNSVPEVDDVVVFHQIPRLEYIHRVDKPNGDYNATPVYASKEVFTAFTFPLIQGNPQTALSKPYTAVISQSLAHKIFGDQNPVGQQILYLRGKSPFTITGVMKDIPSNSSIKTDCFLSFATESEDPNNAANQASEYSYILAFLLKPGVNPDQTAQKIEDNAGSIKEAFEGFKKAFHTDRILFLKPFKEVHFTSDGSMAYLNPVNPLFLKIFASVALLILLMAFVNYINLISVQAGKRIHQLGIQRALGATRFQVQLQIIFEAIALALIAFLLATVVVELLGTDMNGILPYQDLPMMNQLDLLLLPTGLAILFGFFAGLYPAYLLSSAEPTKILHGEVHFSGNGKFLRATLTTLQLVISTALIIGAFTIHRQLNYWKNFDTGLSPNNVIYLQTDGSITHHSRAFAEELLKDQQITDYTYSGFVPGEVQMSWGRDVNEQRIKIWAWPVDERFLHFFHIRMVRGRAFSQNMEADRNDLIINEKAVQNFGWKNPLDVSFPALDANGQVIGVAKNVAYSSLREELQPMVFWLTDSPTWQRYILLKVQPGNLTQTAQYIKNTWAKFSSAPAPSIGFLDQKYASLYSRENKLANFIQFGTLMSLLIALIGIIGLVTYLTQKRSKEIALRKTNGASTMQILALLNQSFIRWIGIAVVIAVPVAWYFMHQWLQNFAYRTNLPWWIFISAGLIVLSVCLLVINYFSYKAANTNPVDSLRNE